MPRFFEGILLITMILGFCIGLAVIIKATFLWVEKNRTDEKSLNECTAPEPKIYLVKQTGDKQKPKPRKKRSPKIAFDGIVLKPENVTLATSDGEDMKSSTLKF